MCFNKANKVTEEEMGQVNPGCDRKEPEQHGSYPWHDDNEKFCIESDGCCNCGRTYSSTDTSDGWVAAPEPNFEEEELPFEEEELPEDPWKGRSQGMRCTTCMFYVEKKSSTGVEIGRCRRNAPTMKGYPAVFPTDWCGEHRIDEEKLLCG